ncbi:MAG: hypothetical protein AB7F89_27120 [Pirellulaceae bacterium]
MPAETTGNVEQNHESATCYASVSPSDEPPPDAIRAPQVPDVPTAPTINIKIERRMFYEIPDAGDAGESWVPLPEMIQVTIDRSMPGEITRQPVAASDLLTNAGSDTMADTDDLPPTTGPPDPPAPRRPVVHSRPTCGYEHRATRFPRSPFQRPVGAGRAHRRSPARRALITTCPVTPFDPRFDGERGLRSIPVVVEAADAAQAHRSAVGSKPAAMAAEPRDAGPQRKQQPHASPPNIPGSRASRACVFRPCDKKQQPANVTVQRKHADVRVLLARGPPACC